MKYITSILIFPCYFIFYTILGLTLEFFFTWYSGLKIYNFLYVLVFLISFTIVIFNLISESLIKFSLIFSPFKKFNAYVFLFYTLLFLFVMMISIWSVKLTLFRSLAFTAICFEIAIINARSFLLSMNENEN